MSGLAAIGWVLWFFIVGAAPTWAVTEFYLKLDRHGVVAGSLVVGFSTSMIFSIIFFTVSAP